MYVRCTECVSEWWVYMPCHHLRSYSRREHTVFILIQAGDDDDDDDDDDDEKKVRKYKQCSECSLSVTACLGCRGTILSTWTIRRLVIGLIYYMSGIQWTYSIPRPFVAPWDMAGRDWTYSIPRSLDELSRPMRHVWDSARILFRPRL